MSASSYLFIESTREGMKIIQTRSLLTGIRSLLRDGGI